MPPTATEQRRLLFSLLGDLPPLERPISAQLVLQEERDGYLLETLLLDLNGSEAVPAYFVKPADHDGKLPVVLYNHAHGGVFELGKDEVLNGRAELQGPSYVVPLTERGYAVLCLDMWGFGERRGRSHSELFKAMLWQGQVLWGMMVYDSLRALDYLTSRDDVDEARVGTLGLSMGSTVAWWLAALDTRVKVCVDLCCLTDFQALLEARGLDGHGLYYYVPGLLKHFTTAQINALIAPRAHLSLAGRFDPLTPAAGLGRIDLELTEVYAAAGALEAWELKRYDAGHYETATMRADALAFLERWL